jgi:chemotaxis protein histidine kinase CheA
LGQLYSVVDLGASLDLRAARAGSGGASTGAWVLVHSQGNRVALLVDAVLGDMDLVIRPLPREVARISIFQGVSSLASGQLILIVRPNWLMGRGADGSAPPGQDTVSAGAPALSLRRDADASFGA